MRRSRSEVCKRTGRFASLVCAGLLLCALPARAVDVGEQAPAFAAPSLRGPENLALSKYRGKVVYLDFWASWCPPCLKSLPLLEGLRKEFAGSDLQILAINLDADKAKALEFLDAHPVGYPIVSDPEGRLPETFQLKTMPSAYLIDRKGVVRYIHRGFRDGDLNEIRERIREVLEAR